jgi:hypothetical protein
MNAVVLAMPCPIAQGDEYAQDFRRDFRCTELPDELARLTERNHVASTDSMRPDGFDGFKLGVSVVVRAVLDHEVNHPHDLLVLAADQRSRRIAVAFLALRLCAFA